VIPICRKILGREPRCPEWTTIGIAAAIAAGVGGVAAGVNSLVNGVYPWEDPLKWMKSEAMGIGTGAVGGALTGAAGVALGPLLGGASGAAAGGGAGAGGAGGAAGGAAAGGAEGAAGALGIGTGTGTVAAEAGAALPQNMSGMVSQAAGKILGDVGAQGTQAAIGETVKNIGTSGFTDQMFQNALRELPKNVIGGAATGAMKDPDDPLRGLLSGAAGGVVSSGINLGVGAAMRGQTAGMWNTTPVKDIEFKYNPDSQSYSVARSELLNPSKGWGMQTTMQQPGVGGRFVNAAAGLGSRAAGGAARMGVRSALTPQPSVAPPNPYAQWGNEYLTRYEA
jgi:hypothetical protein